MRVSILTAEKTLYAGNAQEVILPGEDGEIGVLDFHQPFLYTLRKGSIIIQEKTQQLDKTAAAKSFPNTRIPIKYGIAWMKGNELSVMAEGC